MEAIEPQMELPWAGGDHRQRIGFAVSPDVAVSPPAPLAVGLLRSLVAERLASIAARDSHAVVAQPKPDDRFKKRLARQNPGVCSRPGRIPTQSISRARHCLPLGPVPVGARRIRPWVTAAQQGLRLSVS